MKISKEELEKEILYMKLKYLSLIVVVSVFAFSCGKTAKRAAKDYCNCWQPMADIAQLQDTLKTQGLIDSLATVSLMAEDILEASRLCAEEKKEKYGEKATKTAFNKKARQLMESQCPDVYDRTPKY